MLRVLRTSNEGRGHFREGLQYRCFTIASASDANISPGCAPFETSGDKEALDFIDHYLVSQDSTMGDVHVLRPMLATPGIWGMSRELHVVASVRHFHGIDPRGSSALLPVT